MADDANVTNVVPETPTAGPETDEVRAEPEKPAGSQAGQQRVWSMPKSPVTHKQTDEVRRLALNAGTAVVRFIAGTAQHVARTAGYLSRTIEVVPAPVRLLVLTGVLALVGIVGAISLHNTLGLVCIIVVVPLCSVTLGVLGQRWYLGLDGRPAPRAEAPAVQTSDLQRSMEYVDKKLTLALNAFGAERQQHAMIALFQAKTAAELTLGTEQDATGHVDALLAVENHDARPRIRAGSAPKSLRDNNSLQAS